MLTRLRIWANTYLAYQSIAPSVGSPIHADQRQAACGCSRSMGRYYFHPIVYSPQGMVVNTCVLPPIVVIVPFIVLLCVHCVYGTLQTICFYLLHNNT